MVKYTCQDMIKEKNNLDYLIFAGFILLMLSGIFAFVYPSKAQKASSTAPTIQNTPDILTGNELITFQKNTIRRQNILLSEYAKKLDTLRISCSK